MWPFTRKKEHKGHVLTDEDRAYAQHTRQLQMQADLLDLERMKAEHDLEMARIQAELQEVRGGDGGQDPNMQLLTLFMTILGKMNGQQTPDVLGALGVAGLPFTPTPNHDVPLFGAPVRRTLTDDELRAIKQRMIANAQQQFGVPEALIRSKIKSMGDDELIEKARQYAPDLIDQVDDDTIKRALVVIRE